MAKRGRPKNAEKGQFTSGAVAVENGRKGGQASAESKKQKKLLKEYLNEMLESPHTTKDKKGQEVTMTGAEMMAVKAFQEALKGNPKWWELVRDTVGQKPVEKVEVSNIDTGVIDEIENMMSDE